MSDAVRAFVRETVKANDTLPVQQGTAWTLTGTLSIDGIGTTDIGSTGTVTISEHSQKVAAAMPWQDAMLVAAARLGAHRTALLAILAEGPDAIKAAADDIRASKPAIVDAVADARDSGMSHTVQDIRRVTVTLAK